jgi:hypothetical protein
MSWHSIEVNLRPAALLNDATVKLNRDPNGSGPDALPPNVLRVAPAGRILDKSQQGTCPTYNIPTNSLKALAHPSLLSATIIVVSDL